MCLRLLRVLAMTPNFEGLRFPRGREGAGDIQFEKSFFEIVKFARGVSLAEMYQMSEDLLFENITQGGRPEYNKFSVENYVCFQTEDVSEICDFVKAAPRKNFSLLKLLSIFINCA